MRSKKNFGIVIISFLFMLSCNDQKKNQEQPENTPQNEVKAPDQIVSIEDAKSMYNNYTKKRAELIEATEAPQEDGSKFIASRYADYDIEIIKNYIKYVEQQADSAGVKIETLRFYFSTYPDKKDFPNKKAIKHPRQNSFFILPTLKVDTLNLGFYIIDLADGKKEAALIRDYPNMPQKQDSPNKSEASFLPNSIFNNNAIIYQGSRSLIMNEGQMFPPPPNGSDFN